QRALAEDRPIPLTAPRGSSPEELVSLMRRYDVRQIPLVDDEGRVGSLAVLAELVEAGRQPPRAAVMAGGFGTRLGDLTRSTPKPMLSVGDRPLLQRIVEQLRDAGIRHLNLTTQFPPEASARHVG